MPKKREPEHIAALAAGEKFYVSGRPCRAAHAAPRFTIDSKCAECVKVKDRKASKKYNATPAGKLAGARASSKYWKSPKGRAKRIELAVRDRACAETRARHAHYEHTRGLRRYGITPDDYQTMFKQQNGRCAICLSTDTNGKRRLCVDHCHATNKVRGLLCSACNAGIGHFKDSKITLRAAIAYLCSTNT